MIMMSSEQQPYAAALPRVACVPFRGRAATLDSKATMNRIIEIFMKAMWIIFRHETVASVSQLI